MCFYGTRRHVVLWHKKTCLLGAQEETCLLVEQGGMSSCGARGHVLWSRKTCLLVAQEDMSSHSTGSDIFSWNNKTCLLVPQEDMSSCSARRHAFLFRKKTCILVGQEDMSSWSTGRHVFLFQQADMSSCQESTNSLHLPLITAIRRYSPQICR